MIGPEAMNSGSCVDVVTALAGVREGVASAAATVIGGAAGELVHPIAAAIDKAMTTVFATLDMKILPFLITIRTTTKSCSTPTFPHAET